jgi:predicted nicotinamide N-methyase
VILRSELAALDQAFTLGVEEVDLGGWRVRLEKPRNSDDLISEAEFAKDERLPYWADLWPGAESLAKYLVSQPPVASTPTPSRALELGCGIGLVTIAAMRAGFTVTGTDYYDDALRFTARNAFANLGVEPATRMVDWRAFPADLGVFDLVLAADVLYERAYSRLVATAVARSLAPGGSALIADQGRVGLEEFLSAVTELGLGHRRLLQEQPRVGPPGDLSAPGPTVSLYELRWEE